MVELQIHVQVELKDKNGKVIKRLRKKLCHSYVLQMIDILRANMNLSTDSIVDTSNASNALTIYATWYIPAMRAIAGSGIDTYGIQVGTSSTAVAITQYKLVTQILNGATSTKLSYGTTSVGACATVGPTRQFTISRTFTNNSGADITVNEVALVLALQQYSGTADKYDMVERSLLTFTITNGTSGTVTYTISATV